MALDGTPPGAGGNARANRGPHGRVGSLDAGNEVLGRGDGSAHLNFGDIDPRQRFPTSPVGLIAHVDPSGRVPMVAEGLGFPNGMALSARTAAN